MSYRHRYHDTCHTCVPPGFHQVPDGELERDPAQEPPPIDYAPLLDAARRVTTWLLDIARARTNDPLDLASIDRVARTLDAASCGDEPAGSGQASEEDVLVVLGLLVTAFEVDLRLLDLGAIIGGLYAASDQLADPLLRVIQATLARSRSTRATCDEPLATRDTATAGAVSARVVPVVVRRRPAIAHGGDELDPSRTILVIG